MSKLENDILFVAATRPAMIANVSYSYQVINGFTSVAIFLISGNPLYLMLVVPFHFLGFFMCLNEPRNIEILWGFFKVLKVCVNRNVWGRSTYIQ